MLWIGSDKGVDLFTGHCFIPLRSFINDSASYTQVPSTAITEHENNSIWVGTWGDGLYSVNIESGDYKHYRAENELNNNTISDNYINCLKVYDDQLWIGSNYCLSQKSGNQFIHYNFEEVLTKGTPDIRAIIPRYQHLLSIFTSSGEIIELNTQTGTYHKVGEIKAPLNNITCVEKDQENRYWIGTEYNGLILLGENYNRITPAAPLAEQLSKAHISAITAHSDYGIFIGSDGGGLFIINPADYSFKRIENSFTDTHSLTSNQLESLFIDSNGILWLGYFRAGFSQSMYETDGIEHVYKLNANGGLLPNKNVNCFTEDSKRNIWVGTESGLAVYDKDYRPARQTSFEKKVIKKLENLPVTSLSSSVNQKKIYAGTYNNGLFIIDLKENKITNRHADNSNLESSFIRDVKELNDSLLYVATVDGGFYKYYNDRFEKVKVYFDDKYEIQDFFHIELINKEYLWLSSAGKGVLRIHAPGGKGEVFESVLSTICYCTHTNADQSTYIATNKGIFKYDKPSNTFKPVHTGPEPVDYYGIIEDDLSNIWISSSSGLHRFNHNTLQLKTVSSPNLQGKEFIPGAFYKRNNGQLLFGGTNGFNIVSPERFSSKPNPVNLFISELKLYNTPIKPGQLYDDQQIINKHINYTEAINISHDIDLFSIRVNAIDYFDQSTNIAYTISNNRKQGDVFYSEGEITFFNMQPGKYTLRIYPVSTSDGQIKQSAFKEITIVKKAPWWHSYWLFAALFISIIGIILTLHLLRIRELRKTKRTLQKKITERTAALLSQKERLQYQKNSLQEMLAQNKKLESFKESIINMIVHDLKNPLNGIIGLSSLNEAEYLEHINSASRQMLCLVENILDVRRSETHSLQLFYQHCDIRQLVNEAIDEVHFLLKDNQIEILNQIDTIELSLDKDIIRRVFINLLTNAIKYSKVNGKITLRGTLSDQQKEKMLLLSVQDEGHGIPEKYRESIFDLYQQIMTKKSGKASSNGLGLSFCKIAVNEHAGKIWVESEIGKGATFFIQIPLQKPAD